MDRLARRQLDGAIRQVPLIEPDRWPAAIRDAYDEAVRRGDRAAQERLILAQTGQTVSLANMMHLSKRETNPVDVIEIRHQRTTASRREQS
jgi:hypothetical protein